MADDTITLQLTVTAAAGSPRVPLVISKNITSSDLRKASSDTTGIPLASLKLIVRGRLITDDSVQQAVTEFKLEEGTVLHCIGKPEEKSQQLFASASSSTTMPTVSVLQSNSASAHPPPPVAGTYIDPLKEAIQVLRAANPPATYQTAVTTLEKILSNMAENPMEEKYRKVKKQNPAFQRRLGSLTGGDAAMKACGFGSETLDGEEFYVLNADADAWPKLLASRATVEAAIRDSKATSNQPIPSSGAGFGVSGMNPSLGASGLPNFMPPGLTGTGAGDPMAQLLSDPAGLQMMMQNPMIQAMIQNDPRFANNPMLQHVMQELESNPQMVAQVSQMMRDPTVLRQIEQMRLMHGGMPQPGSGNPGGQPDPTSMMQMAQMMQTMQRQVATGPGSNQQQSNTDGTQGQQSSNANNDADLTEEEMIAEAIRRSLQDS